MLQLAPRIPPNELAIWQVELLVVDLEGGYERGAVVTGSLGDEAALIKLLKRPCLNFSRNEHPWEVHLARLSHS